MGGRHKRLFEEDGVEFIGVADTADEASALFEQILAGKLAPDFAVIASPAITHEEYVQRCIEMMLPVLVEKPVSISFEKAEEFQRLALEQNAFVLSATRNATTRQSKNLRKQIFSGKCRTISNPGFSRIKVLLRSASSLRERTDFRRAIAMSPWNMT